MTQRNFSVGDVVASVEDRASPELRRGGLYTVADAFVGFSETRCCPVAAVILADGQTRHGYGGWSSSWFRYAFTPDPEVAREAAKDPLSAPAEPTVDA